MPITFNEEFFNGDIGYQEYKNYPHFHDRAFWIKSNLSGRILEIGSAHGFLIEELNSMGMQIEGIEKSEYAVSQVDSSINNKIITKDVVDHTFLTDEYDWIISWNTLDCLDDDTHAENVASILNKGAKNQLHIISMHESPNSPSYIRDGYFMKTSKYWRNLFPDAILVCSECRKVYNPTSFDFSKIPLHFRKGVSE